GDAIALLDAARGRAAKPGHRECGRLVLFAKYAVGDRGRPIGRGLDVIAEQEPAIEDGMEFPAAGGFAGSSVLLDSLGPGPDTLELLKFSAIHSIRQRSTRAPRQPARSP